MSNGRQLSPEQFDRIPCVECGCVIFNLVPRVLLLRDRLSPKSPIVPQQAVGYSCAKCGKEPDLNPKFIKND